MHTHERPDDVARPRNLAWLAEEVERAERSGVPVVPVGRRYALARPHASRGLQLRTDGMHRSLGARIRERRDQWAREELVRFEAGARIEAINARLASRGLALPTMGAFTRQSIGGAISTSTHGSGLAAGPMCDLVVSAEVVTGRGRALRVEPANGPTDPARFRGGRCDLVQDDDIFYSVVAGVGALGVLYSVTLRARPDEVLEERRIATSFEAMRDRLGSSDYLASFRDLALIVNPYERRGRHAASLTCIRPALDPNEARPRQRHNIIPTLLAKVPFDRALACVFERVPRCIPAAIDAALGALEDQRFAGRTAEVLAGAPLNDTVDAHAVELSLPIERAVEAAECVFALARDEARRGRYLTAPMTMRFLGPSRHRLSPQYGRRSVMIELITLAAGRADYDLFTPYVELLASLGGRLHLGLGVPRHQPLQQLLANIPELDPWRAVAEELDPRRTFVHRLVRELGLR